MPLRYCLCPYGIAVLPLSRSCPTRSLSLTFSLSHTLIVPSLSLSLSLPPCLSVYLPLSFLSLSLSREQVKQKPSAHFNPEPQTGAQLRGTVRRKPPMSLR